MPPSRREELIEAAMRVFAKHGFHGTNLDMVLQEGGICRMTLYNHFKSKDDLIVAALERRHEQAREAMGTYLAGVDGDAADKLLAVFDFQREWFDSELFCGCIFMKASGEFCDPDSPARQAVARYVDGMHEFLQGLAEDAGFAQPHDVASSIQLLMQGAIVSALALGQSKNSAVEPGDAATQARRAAEQLLSAAPLLG